MILNIGAVFRKGYHTVVRAVKTHVGLLKYLIGIIVLSWVLWSNWSEIVNALQNPLHYWFLAFSALVAFAALLLTFFRWYILVRAQELPFTVSEAVRLGFVGYALSTFLPGSIGGDIIKAACLARQSDRRTVAVSTVLFDRFIGLCGLFWLVAILGTTFWLTGTLDQVVNDAEGKAVLLWITWAALGLMIGSIVVWLGTGFVPKTQVEPWAQWLESIPKVGKSLAELWRAGWMYRSKTTSVLLALGLSLIGHVGFILMFYFAARAVYAADVIPSVWSHFIIIPVGLTFESGFPAPNGVGGAEWGFGKLYTLLDAPAAAGVMGSLIRRLFVTYPLALIGYLVYLRMRPNLPPVSEEPDTPTKEASEPSKDVVGAEA